MSKSQPTEPPVNVNHFARVFVAEKDQLPPQGDCYKSDRGYYYVLNLDGIQTPDAAALLEKAHDQFDVEIVGQVVESGRVTKERVYVESVADVPEGYKAEQGPMGGIYYEADPRGEHAEEVGYTGEPVLAVYFGDIEPGDHVAFENPETEERDIGEVVAVDGDEQVVTVRSGGEETDVRAATFDRPVDKGDGSGEGGNTLTTDTAGVHSTRYSPEEDEEIDLEAVGKSAGPIGKDCDGHHVGPYFQGGYRLEDDEMLCENHGEVVDASALDRGRCPACGDAVSTGDVVKIWLGKNNPWVPYTGPRGGQGWMNRLTGEVRYQEDHPALADEQADPDEPRFDPAEPPAEGYARGWLEPPESIDALDAGQAVEFWDDGYHFGDVVDADGGQVAVEMEDGETYTFDAEQITAVEDDSWDPTDTPDVEFVEASPEEYAAAVEAKIEEDEEMGAFLAEPSAEKFEGSDLHLTPDGDAGAVVSPEGDIQNVFALDDAPSGAGRAALAQAIEAGGTTLDCYDGYLRDLYMEFGFRETGRMEFNPEHAPDGFNPDKYGHPDVVFMHLAPEEPSGELSQEYYDGDEWGDAKEESRRAANPGPDGGEAGGGVRGGEPGADPGAGEADRGSVEPIVDWEPYEHGDEQFWDYRDRVAVEVDGERMEGEFIRFSPEGDLFALETDDGEQHTVDVFDVVEYERQGDDREEVRQELRDHFDVSHDPDLEAYTDDSQYRDFQTQLRTGAEIAEESPMYDHHPDEETAMAMLATTDPETARTLANVQGSAQSRLPEEMTVYRGIDVDPEAFMDRAEEAMAGGSGLQDPGFQSTSLDPGVAEGFGNVTLEIETPYGVYLRAASEHAGEDEVLLPAGVTFQPTDVDRETNTVRVQAIDRGYDLQGVDADRIREEMDETGLSYAEVVEQYV